MMLTVRNYILVVAIAIAQATPSVIIIGAGPSGIAAATRLLQKGWSNLTILEAEGRIGGRINTIPFGDNVVDLGAQWCHGELHNVVFDMVTPLGLVQPSIYSLQEVTAFYDSNGELVPQPLVNRMMKVLNEIVDDEEHMATYNGSVGEFVLERFEKHTQTDLADIDLSIRNMILNWFHTAQNSADGSDSWFKTSAKGYLNYHDSPGDKTLNWGTRGYKTILDVLMQKIPYPQKTLRLEDKTFLNKEVSTIRWNDDQQNRVTVVCKDGSEFSADYVIVTVSLGVLKDQHTTLFQPELPEYKQTAIKGLGIEAINKLIIKFPHRWWPKNETGFSFGWNETAGEFGAFQKELSGDVDSNMWLRDVLGFYSVEHQPTVLLGWVVGPNSRKMELVPREEVKAKVMKLIRFFLGKDFTIPEPEDFVRSTWGTNPHFLGSYSFRSLTTEELNTSSGELARPLKNANNKEVVFFAGEATSEHHFSTVHGAIETGWREADRLHKLYHK